MAIIIFKRCPSSPLEKRSILIYLASKEYKKLTLIISLQGIFSPRVSLITYIGISVPYGF